MKRSVCIKLLIGFVLLMSVVMGLTAKTVTAQAPPCTESGACDGAAGAIAPSAPTATFRAFMVNDGSDAIHLSLTNSNDPSPVDRAAGFQYAFDCGSGYAPWSASNSTTCQPDNNGNPVYRAKVKDKEGSETEYMTAEPVNCAPATAVATTAELNAAIACFNAQTTGDYTVTLAANIVLTATSTTISNTSSAHLMLSGAGSHTLDGAGVYRGLTIAAGNVTVDGLTISHGASDFGGGIHNSGTLTVSNSTLANNTAAQSGGGIHNSGTLSLRDSTLADNAATAVVGGGILNAGTLAVIRSTLADNTAPFGGGIYNNISALTISNSTLTGNSGTIAGGGLYIDHGLSTVQISNSTLAGNMSVAAGGIYNFGGTLALSNSIVADSPTGGECINDGGTLTGTHTLVEDGSCLPIGSDGNIAGDPLLGPLADNGGPTLTHALLTGSPTLDAADYAACIADPVYGVDQRGVSRFSGSCDIGAYEEAACVANQPVVSTDELNYAIACFNTQTAGQYAVTLSADITLTAASTAIDNSSAAHLTLSSAGSYTLDGANTYRGLLILAGNVTVNGLTIANGAATEGGGIHNSGTLTVSNSTIADNEVVFRGGGIYNVGTLTLSNSTLSGNASLNSGGGIYNGGEMTLSNSTLSVNAAVDGGGIFNAGTLAVRNSIVANSTEGGDCFGAQGSDFHHSLVGDGSCSVVGGTNGNLTGDPLLGPLAANGGPTPTHALQAGSPARDVADYAACTSPPVNGLDQRGVVRTGEFCDMGAYEDPTCVVTPSVATTSGLNDAIACFNTKTTGQYTVILSGNLTLTAPSTPIDNGSAAHLTLSGAGSFTLDGADTYRGLTVKAGNVTVNGLTIANGAATEGGGIHNSGTLSVSNSMLSDNIAYSRGGGIYHGGGTLNVNNSTIEGNIVDIVVPPGSLAQPPPVGGSGGGIDIGAGTVYVSNSTIADNEVNARSFVGCFRSDLYGGGIANGAGNALGGALTVSNSTLAGNSTWVEDWCVLSQEHNQGGGGIFSGFTLTVNNSTIVGNNSECRRQACQRFLSKGHGIFGNGVVEIYNSIVAFNGTFPGASEDCSANFFFSYSFDSDGSCGAASGTNGNLTGDPLLGPLADNGGPTQTLALQSSSPAVDAIPDGVNGCNTSITTDQRGVTRPANGACDMGAFELNDAPLAVTVGWFLAEKRGDAVEFRWQTASENGTAGFHLLAADEAGKLRLNDALIASPVVDSVTPTDYAFTAVTDATIFFLQEEQIDGRTVEYGPYELGVVYGAYSTPADETMKPAVWLPLIVRE